MGSHVILNRVRGAALENDFVRRLIRIKHAIQARWLALTFSRRFYRQACNAEAVPTAAPVMGAPAQDLGESLIARSVPPRIHALLQLRVASRIAAIAETEQRMQSCRENGWSNEQIGTAMLANLNGSFSEAEKLLLRYADDMSRTPIDVDRQVLRQLRAYFSPADLLEVTAAIAYENFRTRYRDAVTKLD